MRVLLSLLAATSLSSTVYAGFESMNCSFEWHASTIRTLGEAPPTMNSPKTSTPNSPRISALLKSSANRSFGEDAGSPGGSPRSTSPRTPGLRASSPRSESASNLLNHLNAELASSTGDSSPRGRSRRCSFERREEAKEIHEGGSALFALNGNTSSIQFEPIEGCSIRFELKGSLEKANAGVFVYCKNRTIGKNTNKTFVLTPSGHFEDHLVLTMELPPFTAFSEKAPIAHGSSVKREITRFVATCKTFDPVPDDGSQETFFNLDDTEAESPTSTSIGRETLDSNCSE